MNHDHFIIKGKDETPLFVNRWRSDASPKAVVQLSHGMSEHSDRYVPFAKKLVENGFVVYANDHRGHGKTAGDIKDLGFLAEENGWELVVDDMYVLTKRIKIDFPHLPIFLFGHSMGSFLSRRYIQKYGEAISGVILSGTSGGLGWLAPIANAIAKYEVKRKGKKGKSPLLNSLGTESYNKEFKPIRTDSDWLSRDHDAVDQFIDDPLCGAEVTTGFYRDLFYGMQVMVDPTQISKIPKMLPIYIYSGDMDPVGNFSKGVIKTYEEFKKADIEDVQIKLYKDGRHEMHNELNKEEVYQDVIRWINEHLNLYSANQERNA